MDSNNKEEDKIEMIMEQYECPTCKGKSYINTEDKKEEIMICPFCGLENKNIRALLIDIKEVRQY